MQTFTRQQLVLFGNYLLSKERRERYKKNRSSIPLKDRLSLVNNADVENFIDEVSKNKQS